MRMDLKTIFLLTILIFAPLSGCVDDDSSESDDEGESNQNNEVLFEGDEVGECSDEADNDRDGLFDCDDPNCSGSPACKPIDANNTTGNNTAQDDCVANGGNWTESPGLEDEFYCDMGYEQIDPQPEPCTDAPNSDATSAQFIQRFIDSNEVSNNSTFRIILLTSCKTNLTNDDGTYNPQWNEAPTWNQFVLDSYFNSGSLLGDIGWSAVVATTNSSVQDNTGYYADSDVPVVNGNAEIAYSDGAQFFEDGPWKQNIGHTDNGGQASTLNNGIDSFAWTGSHVNGSNHSTYSVSGLDSGATEYLMTGYAWFTLDHHNFEWTSRPMDEQYRVYALSEPVQLVNGTELTPTALLTNQSEETLPACGDSVVDPGEECDDGNAQGGDGCSSSCHNEQGSQCGDNVVDSDEECDDGNTEGGDGCSSSCQQEDPCANTNCQEGWTCDGDGNCQAPADGTACDDGNSQTTNDQYQSGACVGDPIVCPDGMVFNMDSEQCECPEGQTNCGGECVDIGSDEDNCGSCGQVCGEGYECQSGECIYVGITYYINITSMAYENATLTINALDTVIWTNQDSTAHSVTEDSTPSPIFDSGKISNGESWSYQFNNVGTYEYHCTYHNGMVAEIIVV